MTTDAGHKPPRGSDFLSQMTADRIAGALDLLHGPEAEQAHAFQSIRARTYAWADKLPRNEHHEHAVQIIGGDMAVRVAAEFTKVNEGDRFSKSTSMKEFLADPRADEISRGDGVAEGVPLPPVLLGKTGNEGAHALMVKVIDHVGDVSKPGSERPDMMGDLSKMKPMGIVAAHADLMRDLMEIAKDVPPREERTPYQQKLVAAATFLSTEIAVDGLDWARIGLLSKTDEVSVGLQERVTNALHKISNDSKRLWRDDGVPGYDGQDPRATAAPKPRPHEYDAYAPPSETSYLPRSSAKGPSQGADLADAMASAKAGQER